MEKFFESWEGALEFSLGKIEEGFPAIASLMVTGDHEGLYCVSWELGGGR